MSSTPSTDHQVNGGTPSGDVNTAKNTSTNGTTTAEDLKASLSPPKQAEDKPRLSNGHSEPYLESSSSIDEAPLSEGTLTEEESTLSEPSPSGSPITTGKTSRQVSHEREDSNSSLSGVGGADSELSASQFQPIDSNTLLVTTRSKGDGLEPSSRIGKGLVAEGEPKLREDSDPPSSSEVAVAYSPGGRFLKYDIEIGRGSFKTVYKGLDTETGVAIAWCELQEKRYNKAEQARFKEEVAILKTLQHPNILKLYDSWESTPAHGGQKKDKVKDKVLILVTELMTSGTLKNYMRRLKSIKPKVIRSWGRQILRGLYFLHTRMPPIIHRDLKCDNIFINGTTGLVKIGDLGLATLKRNDVTTVIGTPEFMAPEMYEESYDESVDVYAFGMCLLEMCTQEYPYMECSNPAQIYKRVSQGIKPHAIDKIKDASLREIIERCTTVAKEKRFTVLDLLNHEYFSENFKIEVVQRSEPSDTQSTEPNGVLTVRMNVPNQEANKKNGQESIEFPYDLAKDVPEDVVREMVKSGILHSSLQQMVHRSLRDYVDSVKQKLQGRNKTENPNAEGKVSETKSDTLSTTPSPSPGMSTEAASSDPDPPVVQVQRQPTALSEPVKTDETAAVKEPTQGLDMTGQGAIPPASEKDRTLPLTVSKVPESKPNELLSPISSSEHAPSTGQLVAASTGQAVPQIGLTKDLSTKSQTNLASVESKSYSSAVKEGPSTERQSSAETSVDKPAVDSNQDSNQLKPAAQSESVLHVATPVQEVNIHSDTSAESTPVHQPPQSDTENSVSGAAGGGDKMGTLKKKGSQRGKGKGIRLTLVEHSADNKLICQLATSNGKLLKYQFSMKYDRPEEMFKKFVKGEYLTEADKNEFIQQSNQLIQSAKKGRDSSKSESVQESKPHNLAIQEQGRSRSSTEPALSPPSEVTESTPKAPTEQSVESKSSKTAHLPPTGSPKVEPSKPVSVAPSEMTRTETLNVETSSVASEGWATPMTTPEAKENSNPLQQLASSSASSLNGLSTSKPQPQAENVSTLVTHTTTPHESPRPQSPSSIKSQAQQPLQNTLIAGAPTDSLASCSLPSLFQHFQPHGVQQVCYQPSATSAPRVFEVETVNEDKPDSPETSDMSANGSTENLGREPQRSDSQESNPPQIVAKRFIVQSVPSLESKSDSYIGKEAAPVDITTTTHQMQDQCITTATPSTTPQQPERSKSPRHNSVPYVLPPGVPEHSSQGPRTASVPEYYCTTSVLETGPARERGGITEETYLPLHPTKGVRLPQDPRVYSQEHYSTTSALESGPRGGITEDTYVHPMYRRYQSSSTIHSYPPYPASEPEVLVEQESASYPVEQHSQQFNIDELPQAGLLSEAFMRFMHSMSTVFRDPTFQPLISHLDRRFNPQYPVEPGATRPSRQECSSEFGSTRPTRHEYPSEARPSRQEYQSEPGRISRQEPPVFRSTTDPCPVPPGDDPELRAALEEIEEEQKKLDRKRQQMIENFQRRKHSSGNSSLESSSGLPDSRKISTTSYDSYAVSSPTQGRRFAKLTEYEEAGTGTEVQQGSPTVVHKPGSVPPISEMERRVRDELMADKLRSDTSSPSHFDYRSKTPQYSVPSRTVSTSNPLQPDHGGSLSPSYQTSPPPTQQTVGMSTFQVQTSPAGPATPQAASLAKIGHLDSSEWTEYTSAPAPQQASGYVDSKTGNPTSGANPRSTVPLKSNVPVSSNSKADVSEFDPITSHSQFARPKS